MALPTTTPPSGSDKRADADARQKDALLREVDEALRQDQLSTIYQRYGKQIIAAVLGGLLLFGGWLWWNSSHESGLEATSEELVKALDQVNANRIDTASKAFASIEETGGQGAVAIAKMSRAALALKEGKPGDAAKLYGEIAADGNLPQPYRDIATIRQISLNYERMKPADVVEQLKPLTQAGSPYFGSAAELLGAAYMDMGKPDLAGPLFAQIAKDEKLPATQRSRARQLAGLLGVDAIVDVDQTLKALEQEGGAGGTAQ